MPILTAIGVLSVQRLSAQDGVQGIDDANTMVRDYFEAGINLMYAIGAVVGVIGAIKV